MIYLIESFMRGDNDHPLRCLKIGYAKDIEDRLKTYRTHNPSVKLLKTREGDYELENYLHKYFKRYELSGYQEWFIYSKIIVNEFDLIEIPKEEYIKTNIINEIIPKTYEATFSKTSELLNELEKEFNNGVFKDNIHLAQFPKDLCNIRIKEVLCFLKNKEVDFYKNFNFLELPQMDEMCISNEHIFTYYKFLSKNIIMKEYEKLKEEKLQCSKKDIENYELLKLNSGHQENFLFDLRIRIMTLKNKKDYTGIDEKTGQPEINQILIIAEQRAIDMRSNIYL